MDIVNEFYDGQIAEMPQAVFDEFFIVEIKEYLLEKMGSALGKMLSSDPVSYDEFKKILEKGFSDLDYNKQFILERLSDFAQSCKIKSASNNWVLDYFYLSSLRELFTAKKVDKVTKTEELNECITKSIEQIDSWIDKMTVAKKGLFKKASDEETSASMIDPDEYYNSVTDLTTNVFQIYHSLIAGREKERNDVDYEYRLSLDPADFDDISPDEMKDAVKSAKIQKGQEAINVFKNMISLFYTRQCR